VSRISGNWDNQFEQRFLVNLTHYVSFYVLIYFCIVSRRKSKNKMAKLQSATKSSLNMLGLDAWNVWDTTLAFAHMQAKGEAATKRSAERRLNALGLLPPELTPGLLLDELDRAPNRVVLNWAVDQARKRRDRVLFVQLYPLPSGEPCMHANDARGTRLWVPMASLGNESVHQALSDLQRHIGKPVAIISDDHRVWQSGAGGNVLLSAKHVEVFTIQHVIHVFTQRQGVG
jgi:hypothetical protein